MTIDSRLGSYVNAAAALGASRLEAEAADHAGYVFEAPGVSWKGELMMRKFGIKASW